MMTSGEYQWHVDLVKQRYAAYNLSYEQAEQVYRYEQDISACSDEHSFSVWEELDYQLTTFKEILKGEELSLFLANHQAQLQTVEKNMIEWDNNEIQLKNLEYAGMRLKYYKEVFVPSLWENENIRFFSARQSEYKEKITYLKAEYRKYLAAAKKGILVSSYRHNRTLSPNELKQQLLSNECDYIWPNYNSFYHKADIPTKSVADFLYKKISYRGTGINGFIKSSMEESTRFFNDRFKQHFGELNNCYVVTSSLSEEEEIGNFRMNLLLMDPPDLLGDALPAS
jgi:hypothetical protein